MIASDQCRFLEDGPVKICAAFMGGLRTPRMVELESTCRTPAHSRCPFFLARMRREAGAQAAGAEVAEAGSSTKSKEGA